MRILLTLLITVASSSAVAGQQDSLPRDSLPRDSLMAEAVRLATEGQTDSAHAIVRSRLQETPRTDPLYAEILFTGGVVASTLDSARAYFRRVSIEHSNSPWADRALLRLAQLAYGEGDLASARRSAERIITDYPFSGVRANAAFVLARSLIDNRQEVEACRYLTMASREAGDDVELANRVEFYLQRCSTGARDSVTARGARMFSVQVAAVQNPVAADELMRGLRREGFDAQVVREGGYLKVRVGRFSQRAEADSLARQLRQRMGGEPFVVEIP